MQIRINDTEYSLKNEFKDFTLREGKELHTIIFNAPESLKQLYNATTEKELEAIKLTDEDTIKLFPNFYGEVLAYCANIPDEVMDSIMSTERIEIYKGYLEELVMGMIQLPKEIESITEFEWKGETYHLPQADTVLGTERLGAGMAALEYTEETDVRLFVAGLEGGRYENAANVISILARPKGEKYDEKKSLARVEMFMELPLDIVHSVFFSLIDSMRKYSLAMLPFLIQGELGAKERVMNPL